MIVRVYGPGKDPKRDRAPRQSLKRSVNQTLQPVLFYEDMDN